MSLIDKKYKILIVDDDKVTRSMVKSILVNSIKKFEFDEAVDAEEAFNYIKNVEYDCILLDYILPDLTGIQFIEKLNEDNVSIPVIMLTGKGDESLAVKVLKAGAYDYIPKIQLADELLQNNLPQKLLNVINEFKLNDEREKSRKSLELSEERYRGLIENSQILIVRFFSDDYSINYANDGLCNYGDIERFDVIGEKFMDFLPEESHESLIKLLNSLNRDIPMVQTELPFALNEEEKWQIWTIQVILDENNYPIEFQAMGEDITEIKKTQKKMDKQKVYLQSIIDSLDNMLFVANKEKIFQVNTSLLNYFDFYDIDELRGEVEKFFNSIVVTEGYFYQNNLAEFIESLLTEIDKTHMIKMKPENALEEKVFSIKLSKLKDDNEFYVVTFSDVTELQKKSENFEIQATVDNLTGAFNRRKFHESLEFTMEFSKRYKDDLSIIYFDIDHFKQVNDNFGHKAGDSVLVELSALIKNNLRKTDVFARWGGEEFIILAPKTSLKNAGKLAEKLRKEIEKFTFQYVKKVTCSFGVSVFDKNEDGDTFINRSDKALYIAKESGRNRVVAMRKKITKI